VIIVSWNVRDLLRRCIESVLSTRTNLSVETIVVDNASVDGSADMVRDEFSEVRLIPCTSNLGFGRANNLGLAHATGRYVFFLNPDTLLLEHTLIRLTNFLDSEPQFDIVGPRLVDANGNVQRVCARTLPTLTLTLFGALYLHRLPFVGSRLSQRLISPYDLARAQEVGAISGAAMFARRAAIEQVGGFDEAFLHTAEDVDLCVRVRQDGYRIFYLPDAQVVHFGGQSAAVAPVRTETMGFLSMEEYFRRSQGRLHSAAYRVIVQVVQMPMLLLVGLGKTLVSRDVSGLRERWRLARAVWGWRVAE
jgi:GT2 family glycosyltransferase